MPAAMSWRRSSVGVSIKMRVPRSLSTTAPTRVRLSRGSADRHTSQLQPSCGTPKLVPVPRKISFIAERRATSRLNRFDFQEVGGAGNVERNARRHHDAVAHLRQLAMRYGIQSEP